MPRTRKRNKNRRLLFEPLESRRLLNGDWRNPVNSLDVNDDTYVTPIDVPSDPHNDINANGSGCPPMTDAVPAFVDVTR